MAHMQKDYGAYAGLILVAFLFVGFVLMLANAVPEKKHVNPCTTDSSQCYSIQGLYSQRNCPGQHPWFVEVQDVEFFMGCRS